MNNISYFSLDNKKIQKIIKTKIVYYSVGSLEPALEFCRRISKSVGRGFSYGRMVVEHTK